MMEEVKWLQYAETVQECRKEFKLFDKSKLESAFGDVKMSSDAILEKMDLIEQQVKSTSDR